MIEIHPAGPDHQVATITGAKGTYRRSPCDECPWRRDAPIGAFPAEAYRHSARTAYDMSRHAFSCHMSGVEKPATCAGFLLRGAVHNLGVRLARMMGLCLDVSADVPLYDSYRAMAIANGVDADDPALAACREAWISARTKPVDDRRKAAYEASLTINPYEKRLETIRRKTVKVTLAPVGKLELER